MNSRFKFRVWSEGFQDIWYLRDNVNDYICGNNDVFYNNNQISKPIIMQWTGLEDKNDIDIYEGDIVKVKVKYQVTHIDESIVQKEKEYILVVRWNSKTFSYGFWFIHNGNYFEVGYLDSKEILKKYNIEIIGNKFENPELLKKE